MKVLILTIISFSLDDRGTLSETTRPSIASEVTADHTFELELDKSSVQMAADSKGVHGS